LQHRISVEADAERRGRHDRKDLAGDIKAAALRIGTLRDAVIASVGNGRDWKNQKRLRQPNVSTKMPQTLGIIALESSFIPP
jgi:hypothetical protein